MPPSWAALTCTPTSFLRLTWSRERPVRKSPKINMATRALPEQRRSGPRGASEDSVRDFVRDFRKWYGSMDRIDHIDRAFYRKQGWRVAAAALGLPWVRGLQAANAQTLKRKGTLSLTDVLKTHFGGPFTPGGRAALRYVVPPALVLAFAALAAERVWGDSVRRSLGRRAVALLPELRSSMEPRLFDDMLHSLSIRAPAERPQKPQKAD